MVSIKMMQFSILRIVSYIDLAPDFGYNTVIKQGKEVSPCRVRRKLS